MKISITDISATNGARQGIYQEDPATGELRPVRYEDGEVILDWLAEIVLRHQARCAESNSIEITEARL